LFIFTNLIFTNFFTKNHKPNFDELFFQQDGAPPHYVLKARDLP